jgi:nicotinamidase-related amidase
MLRRRGVEGVHTTIREAIDRGFRCIAVADACGSCFPEFHDVALRMIAAQGGIFGRASDVAAVRRGLGAGR